MVLVIGVPDGGRHRRDDGHRAGRPGGDGQDSAATGLLVTPFQLPFEFALGRRTSRFIVGTAAVLVAGFARWADAGWVRVCGGRLRRVVFMGLVNAARAASASSVAVR